jgi:hypothetical protein
MRPSIGKRFRRLRLTLDYTQGCTLELRDAGIKEIYANRPDVEENRRKRRRDPLL